MVPPANKPALAAHCRRAAAVATDLALRLGLPPRERQIARDSALLHHHPPEALDLGILDTLVADARRRNGAPLRPDCQPDRRSRQELLQVLLTFHSGSARVVDEHASALSDLLTVASLLAEALEIPAPAPDARSRVLARFHRRVEEGLCRPGVVKALKSLPDVGIQDLAATVSGLPVYAAVALQALTLAADDNVSFQRLEALVSSDQMLAGRLVRVANSWAYSPRQGIASIRAAISYIGVEATRKLVTAVSFQGLFASARLRDLWKHSVDTARLCERMAPRSRVGREEAFLAGLVHDVGRLAIPRLPGRAGEAHARLLEDGCEPVFAERYLLGFSHAEAGALILGGWNFPERIVEAVRHHHAPDSYGSELAALLSLAEAQLGPGESIPSEVPLDGALARAGTEPESLAQSEMEIGLLECLALGA